MNRIVRRPRRRASAASPMADRKSLTPASTADIDARRAPACAASSLARVVLPVPGGPQKDQGRRQRPAFEQPTDRAAFADEVSWPT